MIKTNHWYKYNQSQPKTTKGQSKCDQRRMHSMQYISMPLMSTNNCKQYLKACKWLHNLVIRMPSLRNTVCQKVSNSFPHKIE